MDLLQTDLESLNVIHSSGSAVKETSYYGRLENLLNEVGKALKPRVRCIINIAHKGAGFLMADCLRRTNFKNELKAN